jgi:hypothetical protein
MAEVADRWPVTPGALVSISGQCRWHLWWKTWYLNRLLSRYVVVVVSVLFHQCSILVFVYMLLLPERQRGRNLETWQERCCAGNHGALGRKMPLFFFFRKLGSSMLQADAVFHQSAIADPRVRYQAIPRGSCDIQSDTGKGPLPSEDFYFPPACIVNTGVP